MVRTNHQRLIVVNRVDEFYQMRLFEPSDNTWFELLCLDLESLTLQASVIYNVDLNEVLNKVRVRDAKTKKLWQKLVIVVVLIQNMQEI